MCAQLLAAPARLGAASRNPLSGRIAQSLGLVAEAAPERSELTLSDVEIINPGRERIPGATVRIREGRIAAIERDSAEAAGERRFLLPGLIDMHVHTIPGLTDFFARLQLMHGVTSVRNTAADDTIFGYRASLSRGERSGPRLFACGPSLDGKPNAFPAPFAGASLATPEAGRRRVRRLAALDADFLKVFINLTPPVLEAIREEASLHGLPVTGHVPRFSRIETAGVVDVQHLTGLPDHPSTAFALDGAFRPWLEAWRQIDEDRVLRVSESCLEHGVAQTATLVLWKGIARCIDETIDRPPTQGLVPAAYVEAVWNNPRPAGPYTRAADRATMEAAREAFPRMLETVASLRESGVAFLPGTDTINAWVVPGAGLHEELRLFESTGFSPEETLEMATRIAGERLGLPGLGTIAEGAPADCIVLREDPTRDLAALDSLEQVVVDGRRYTVSDLRAKHLPGVERFDGLAARWAAKGLTSMARAFYSALPAPAVPAFEGPIQ